MTLCVVDLSHVKAISDWDALCRFADILIFKATEGPDFADPLFTSRLAEARRRGKLIGYYHYVGWSELPGRPARVFDPTVEADWFARHFTHQPGEVPIADWEPYRPPADPDGWLAAWLDRMVTAHDCPMPMTYMNTLAAASNPWTKARAAGTGLWIARYYANNGQVPTTQPSPGSFGSYAMWQYTSNGVVPGVLGPCDVSLFYGTADQWRAFGTTGATPTPPPTVQEDDMRLIRTPDGTIWTVTDQQVLPAASLDAANSLCRVYGIQWLDVSFADKDAAYLDAAARRADMLKKVQSYVLGADPGPDPQQWLFPRVVGLGDAVSTLQSGGVDPQQVAGLVIEGIKAIFAAQQPPAAS